MILLTVKEYLLLLIDNNSIIIIICQINIASVILKTVIDYSGLKFENNFNNTIIMKSIIETVKTFKILKAVLTLLSNKQKGSFPTFAVKSLIIF